MDYAYEPYEVTIFRESKNKRMWVVEYMGNGHYFETFEEAMGYVAKRHYFDERFATPEYDQPSGIACRPASDHARPSATSYALTPAIIRDFCDEAMLTHEFPTDEEIECLVGMLKIKE